MNPRMRSSSAVTAVIAAAGSGERLGAGGPKAFVPVAGRPMVEWSVDAFRACDSVRSIVVAAPPGHIGDLAGHDLGVVPGGSTRAESVANALAAVGTAYVAIHDAARPLLTPELVEALVADLDANEDAAGTIAAAPVTDTIKRAASRGSFRTVSDRKEPGDEDPSDGSATRGSLRTSGDRKEPLVVEGTEDRSRLWRAQTPQVFRAEALREALAAAARPDEATDEAMLVEANGGTVLIHPVIEQNLKVTTSLDLRVAELLLAER
ncbi:MAG TPA: 2-C-methyl-D-erythritol 4-phosphate cytidylyltransferase [Solirubrobacterales bacterium]|nr:2-C-methyl-D-erythritol 4-phosphate cytidylyltransferase [Solirubrobacterales bacterium]